MKKTLLWAFSILAIAAIGAWLYPPLLHAMTSRLSPEIAQRVSAYFPTQEPAKTAPGQKKGPPPAPVTAALVTLSEMPIILSAPGTAEAAATIIVKPRVDGQIAEVLFREGDLVENGQVIFRLDDRLIRAQIQQVEANIKRDQAGLAEAEANYGRRSTLVQKKIVSEAAMDTARTSVDTLKANIAANQAALEAQRTQLDYLTIRAPIRGRTGSVSAKPGSNVRAADAAPLVIINQTQPVSVVFAVPQTEIAALRRALAAGATATVTVAGAAPQSREGKIDFIDNQVDKQTGTLTAKLEIPNKDELLWPGQSVEVALAVEKRPNMLTLSASAVLPSQQGMIVWVIGPDNRVQPKPVVLDRIVGQIAYLSSGIAAGDKVVTDGHVRIAPGAPVTIQEPGQRPDAKGDQGDKGARGGKGGKSAAQDERKS